jgi:lipid-binding SYLF domain-containing protein
LYGKELTNREILGGKVKPAASAKPFMSALGSLR